MHCYPCHRTASAPRCPGCGSANREATPERVVAVLEALAAKGDARGSLELAWFQLAAARDEEAESPARLKLAYRGFDLTRRAAAGGSLSAWFEMGQLFAEGTDAPLDDARALTCLEVAADGGLPEALVEVAARIGGTDPAGAARRLEAAAAYPIEDAEACMHLGCLYARGADDAGIAVDRRKARMLLRKCVDDDGPFRARGQAMLAYAACCAGDSNCREADAKRAEAYVDEVIREADAEGSATRSGDAAWLAVLLGDRLRGKVSDRTWLATMRRRIELAADYGHPEAVKKWAELSGEPDPGFSDDEEPYDPPTESVDGDSTTSGGGE